MPAKDKADKTETPNPTRRQQLKKDGIEKASMPEVDAHHILEYLWEIGPTASSSGKHVAISHAEIAAWQHNTGIALDAFEARSLRALSVVYLEQWFLSTQPDCPPPWTQAPELNVIKHQATENMRASMRALAAL